MIATSPLLASPFSIAMRHAQSAIRSSPIGPTAKYMAPVCARSNLLAAGRRGHGQSMGPFSADLRGLRERRT